MNLSHRLMFGAATSAMLIASAACGISDQIYSFDLPAQPLKASLRQVTQTAGIDLFAMSGDLADRQAPPLHGQFTVVQAVDRLLVGSGLTGQLDGRRMFIRPLGPKAGEEESAQIVVTGTRIRGAPVASPVISLTQRDILDTGKTTLGDAVRTLPQNFGGGQNPGIAGNGSQANNSNFNSSSTINLRGLGADATLTLINGHRVAYDANVQGVDIDAIPLAALDRIEIVPDGSSALYGSDAVGGVANVILKKDYQGATVTARYGAATDGGGEQQQYSGVTGARWSGGGVLAAIDYSHDRSVDAGKRSYTQTLSPDQTLDPAIRHVSAILAGHQSIGDAEFSIDAMVSHRSTVLVDPFVPPETVDENGLSFLTHETSFEVSPRLELPLGSAWRAYLTGTYARDRSTANVDVYSGGAEALTERVRFFNSFRTIEAGADGPLLRLFGKTLRAALGGGYRSNGHFVGVDLNGVPSTATFVRQSTYYAFGELNLPLVTPSADVAGIHALSTSAAVRYEDYPGHYQIATPKFGLIYQPTTAITLKSSWGRSFKAPTLDQQFSPTTAVDYPISYAGNTNYPATSTFLSLTGGNPDLKPEKATSWVVTAEYKPTAIEGLDLEISYFHTRYTSRVVDRPISSYAGVFAAPQYQYLIDYGPSLAALDAIVGAIPGGVISATGAPYDPSSVVAVIDNRWQNAAKQVISGVDVQAQYRLSLGDERSLAFSGSASYLRSRQQLGPDQALLPVSGQIFQIPKWNARTGLTYSSPSLTITANVSYIGGVTDDRFPPTTHVAGMAPVDLTFVYHVRSPSMVLDHTDLTLTVQNLLNDKPSVIRSTAANDITYDSSNYPTIGRFVGFTVSKSF